MPSFSMSNKIYAAIGLMSGTSLDGIDAAMLKTDGKGRVEPIAHTTIPYTEKMKSKIRDCFGKTNLRDPDVVEAERQMTFQHAEAVASLLRKTQMLSSEVDLIGFHGQTIFHDPANKKTVQIGDGDLLAQETNISVVNDFRSADVQAGGQGAPFLPLYHWARVKVSETKFPVAILNLGGVANVTWIGENQTDIIAFDTGPGNALIDDFIYARTGKPFDEDGEIASSGKVNQGVLDGWMSQPFFSLPVPKSLDRNAWNISQVKEMSTEEGAATLTAFTVDSIKAAEKFLPEAPKYWYVAGGGRHNTSIMNGLKANLSGVIQKVDDLGWSGDALEAEGFAYLAVRSVEGLPLSLPTTTGVPTPQTGGVLHKAA